MNHEHKHSHENCDCTNHEKGRKSHKCPTDDSLNNWMDKIIDQLKKDFSERG